MYLQKLFYDKMKQSISITFVWIDQITQSHVQPMELISIFFSGLHVLREESK